MKSLALLVVLISVSLVSSLQFNCNREGQDCEQGACIPDGSCDCYTGFGGYKCQQAFNATGNACSDDCDSDLCSLDDLVCVCTEDKYGDECEFQRFQHICGVEGEILINANVEGADVVFINNDTACPLYLSSVTMPPGWTGYARIVDIPFDDDCGQASVSTTNGVSKVCVTAYIRYRDDYWTGLDTKVTYCCAGSNELNVEVASIDVSGGIEGTTLQPAGSSAYIMGEFRNEAATQTITSATIGQVVVFRLKLSSDAPFVGTKPIECDLIDDPDDIDGQVDLINGGCASGKLDSTLTLNNDGTYDLKFTMVRFVGSPKVHMKCDIRLCAVAKNCEDTCALPANNRRRRAASSNTATEEVDNYVVPLEVIDPILQNEETSEYLAECERRADTTPDLSAAVIGLAVVVLILLIVCLILAVCLIKKRRPSTTIPPKC